MGIYLFTDERADYVDEIYNKIRDLLSELDMMEGWKKYRGPSGEYFVDINHLFINKCLFENNEISIGIYEDVFSEDVSDKITVEYFSEDEMILEKFINFYKEKEKKPINNIEITEGYGCFYWRFDLNKKEFLDNVKECLRTFILNYLDIMKNYLELMD